MKYQFDQDGENDWIIQPASNCGDVDVKGWCLDAMPQDFVSAWILSDLWDSYQTCLTNKVSLSLQGFVYASQNRVSLGSVFQAVESLALAGFISPNLLLRSRGVQQVEVNTEQIQPIIDTSKNAGKTLRLRAWCLIDCHSPEWILSITSRQIEDAWLLSELYDQLLTLQSMETDRTITTSIRHLSKISLGSFDPSQLRDSILRLQSMGWIKIDVAFGNCMSLLGSPAGINEEILVKPNINLINNAIITGKY